MSEVIVARPMRASDLIASLLYAVKVSCCARVEMKLVVEDFFAALNRRGVIGNAEAEFFTTVALREL